MPRPNTVDIASAISSGVDPDHDPWKEHQSKFSDLGIDNRQDYKNHIDSTMNDKSTVVLEAGKDATIYVNINTYTVAVHDPHRIDQGTCFRVSNTDEYLDKKRVEQSQDNNLGRPPLELTGGHEAFYDAKEQRDATNQRQSASQPELQTTPEPTTQAPDLSRVNLSSYAEAEHGYKVEPKPLGALLTKDGEELRAVRTEDGTWSYSNPQDPNDKGDIIAFAASRGGGTPQQAEASVSSYLSRNPDAYEASVSDTSRSTTRDKGADPTDF